MKNNKLDNPLFIVLLSDFLELSSNVVLIDKICHLNEFESWLYDSFANIKTYNFCLEIGGLKLV
jgi:hypothetical protein